VATVVGYTKDAVDGIKAALETEIANKADLVGGVLPDDQAPAIAVKKDSWLISVMDHGGTGDGVASDAAALASSISAVNPTFGGKVYLPPGKYRLDGSNPLNLLVAGTILEGAGALATQIVIDPTFTGAEAIYIAAKNCQVKNLTIIGTSTTTTSNPICDGIKVNSVRRARIEDCEFWYINGWAFQALASTTDASGNPDGTMLSRLTIRQCAGGIHFLGNTVSGYAVNSFMSDIEIIQGGVTTGASSNLDNILIEDSWDILISNLMSWMSSGTGSSLHIKGNCAATFVQVLDALGPSTGPCVLIEDSANGSPQNVQIQSGVVQQGLIGLQIKGGATLVTLRTMRVINNQGHGISVESNQPGVNLFGLNFSTSGNSASGTNYDLNWSGSATGIVDQCRFSSPITAVGVAGVQASVNIAAGQNVRFMNDYFTGSGNSSANWFTATPSAVFITNNGAFQFQTQIALKNGATVQGNLSLQPTASGNTVLSSNTGGSATFDSWRLDGNGSMNAGSGSAARDTTWGRQGAAQFGTSDSDLVVGLLGKGLRIKSGTNGRVQTATLVGGTVTIANTSITSTTCIIPFYRTPGGTHGALYVDAVTVGTSCVIKSTNASDTSTIGILLVEAT
jgi:hypothetical protein